MPKDPTRNVNRYKIGGGQLNEFEFQAHQAEMQQAERERFEAREGEVDMLAPQTEAERIQQLMAEVHEKVQRKKERQGVAGGEAQSAREGAKSTKKAATKRAAPVATTAKKSAKKATAKKAAAKKSVPKKPAAKKSVAKRSVANKVASTKATAARPAKSSAKKSSAKKSVRATRPASKARKVATKTNTRATKKTSG